MRVLEAYFGCADGAQGTERRVRRDADIELVGRVSARRAIEEHHRRRACRPRLGRQPQLLHHAPNDGGMVDEREPPATAGQARTSRPKLRRISSAPW